MINDHFPFQDPEKMETEAVAFCSRHLRTSKGNRKQKKIGQAYPLPLGCQPQIKDWGHVKVTRSHPSPLLWRGRDARVSSLLLKDSVPSHNDSIPKSMPFIFLRNIRRQNTSLTFKIRVPVYHCVLICSAHLYSCRKAWGGRTKRQNFKRNRSQGSLLCFVSFVKYQGNFIKKQIDKNTDQKHNVTLDRGPHLRIFKEGHKVFFFS